MSLVLRNIVAFLPTVVTVFLVFIPEVSPQKAISYQ